MIGLKPATGSEIWGLPGWDTAWWLHTGSQGTWPIDGMGWPLEWNGFSCCTVLLLPWVSLARHEFLISCLFFPFSFCLFLRNTYALIHDPLTLSSTQSPFPQLHALLAIASRVLVELQAGIFLPTIVDHLSFAPIQAGNPCETSLNIDLWKSFHSIPFSQYLS